MRKTREEISQQVACDQTTETGFAERAECFLDKNFGLVAAAVTLPIAYTALEGAENKVMLGSVLFASVAILAQSRMPDQDKKAAFKRKALHLQKRASWKKKKRP